MEREPLRGEPEQDTPWSTMENRACMKEDELSPCRGKGNSQAAEFNLAMLELDSTSMVVDFLS